MRNFPIRLPSLDLIRGFVAVGRRMSITLAAEDLFLTQSAVSRQIIALEEALGVRLLNRGYARSASPPKANVSFASPTAPCNNSRMASTRSPPGATASR
jgi:LysR family transcriptional regulator, glycine cleavage system transcriptional activator